jgi:hypothetical protein
MGIGLRVENNNKWVRGKSKVRRLIEDDVLSRFKMEKKSKDGCDYVLLIPYTSDEELDEIIYEEICGEAAYIADCYNGFTETSISSLENPERTW